MCLKLRDRISKLAIPVVGPRGQPHKWFTNNTIRCSFITQSVIVSLRASQEFAFPRRSIRPRGQTHSIMVGTRGQHSKPRGEMSKTMCLSSLPASQEFAFPDVRFDGEFFLFQTTRFAAFSKKCPQQNERQ